MMNQLALISAITLAFAGCGAQGLLTDTSGCGARSGKVVRVIDGDTVELEDGREIRYLLVDTPEVAHSTDETSECFGDEARMLNEELVLNRTVSLDYDIDCLDSYNRTLAYVYLRGRMLNKILIERGYAKTLIMEPNVKHADELVALEEEAKALPAGIWGVCQ